MINIKSLRYFTVIGLILWGVGAQAAVPVVVDLARQQQDGGVMPIVGRVVASPGSGPVAGRMDGMVSQLAVRTGSRVNKGQVLVGLAKGDQVVVRGNERLQPGQKVTIVKRS